MTINELITKRKEISNNDQWNKLVDAMVKIKSYVPYAQKMVHANAIVEESYLDNGRIKFNTCKMYSLQLYALLTLYTDIEIDGNEWVKTYDLMREYDILDDILDRIPKREVDELTLLIKLCKEDLIANNYETHAFWEKQIDKVAVFLGSFLNGSLQSLNTQLERMNVDTETTEV